eukprot:2819392-Pleurochrysis_carterae.AAC.4
MPSIIFVPIACFRQTALGMGEAQAAALSTSATAPPKLHISPSKQSQSATMSPGALDSRLPELEPYRYDA